VVGCESSTTRRPRLSCAGRLEGVLCDRRVPAYHPGCRTGKRTVSTRRCRGLSSNALLFCIPHILLLAVALAESTGIWTDGIENGTYGYADHLEEVNYTFQVCHHGADQRRVRHASCVRLARSTGGYTRAPGRTGSAISTDLATAVHALKPYVAAACRRLDTSPPATQTDDRTLGYACLGGLSAAANISPAGQSPIHRNNTIRATRRWSTPETSICRK